MIKHTRIFLVFSFLAFVNQFYAQRFLQGIALFAGETSSRDRYINTYPLDFKDDPTFLHAQPPSHKSTERESWSVGFFAEMLKSYDWRWVTEIDFCNKGAVENELLNPITDQKRVVANHYANIQWNNYLKRWIDLGFRFKTYAMVGARLEYTIARSTPAYSYISGRAAKLTVSPDVIPLFREPKIAMWNRTWETRIGIIYRFRAGIGSVDLDCNAPRYHGR